MSHSALECIFSAILEEYVAMSLSLPRIDDDISSRHTITSLLKILNL